MKAVIFDFDGTIVDTESLWVDVYIDLIEEKYGHTVPMTIFNKCVGTKDTALYDYLTEYVDASIKREQLSPLAEQLVNSHINSLPIRQGILSALDRFKAQGLRIAIASGSQRHWILSFIQENNLTHYFEEIRCADDVENVKPSPDIYLAALEALNLTANECFAIEDSVNGATAAIRADIKCYVVPNEVTALDTFPLEVIRLDSFDDILV
ncbi:haloacid dehalogenase [Kurthia zopfii]|uniref:Hydrolase of the HAD superfamily n=1 Tax=Kurthia zopfii TaxID=1650 RepID=A0A8B4Q8L1_9BACL|nr:HAD-IA family hydrolase [Kurthia zopfii]PWI21800.1 HAD family hydrolase [Kurthia zopfii]TDR33391.1 putative hydrolase of the HAD superfamily [Kurthia zopfii]GEK32041.1 haloacid dehalogenase [Kurthia zopfii]STX08504.1 Phosphorylated carbohydrates phosphatase TM_1254 [Kurthia zopfii]